MNSKHWLIILGTLISIVLLVVVFARLDWQAFFTALQMLQLFPLVVAALVVSLCISLRALRWNLVAAMPLTQFKHFWQAGNIGYLGNMIYPARAGEVLRIIAIRHFTNLKLGRAASSSIIDRMIDLIILGMFTLLVVWLHGNRLSENFGRSAIVTFAIAIVALTFVMIYAERWEIRLQQWITHKYWQQRLRSWTIHSLEGVRILCHTNNLLTIMVFSISIFFLDYLWIWEVIVAFGWSSLPVDAALTVGVFTVLGATLPSAPGYIGVYQVACVLALGLYGIDESHAVAYSIVLQLLSFAVIGVQGALVTLYCGFNLSKESQQVEQQDFSHYLESEMRDKHE